MTRSLFLCLPLLALAACTQQPSPSGTEAAVATPPAAAAPAAATTAAAPIAPVPAVPSMSAQATGDAQASGQPNGERPTLMVTSTSGTIDCDGHNLDITGRDARLVLRGQCGTIALLGANGTLQIEHAEGVRVVGDNAQVVMRSDAKSVELFGRHGNLQMGRIEELAVPGDDNQLRAVAIGSATLHGSKNRLTQQTGKAQVQDYGRDNQIAGN
ncbi:DUF3060 domain-containing protein [Xanthomonas bonasiae]|uniref:DUF3060 domain-containing protein n=1 Tax=Xanthomonas bonasiae TaxID=2810351 RepID=UPI00177CDDD4|nr:DUF3060 domain-containing protein [Xanthomonas surreyensis]MBD7920552.1 DUF3060 domain-containing protein [Xanthomonas surreyensis]